MFEKGKVVSKAEFPGITSRLKSITWVLTIALMALLVSTPIHATDPIDFDPDPDFASANAAATTTTMIFVEAIDQVDLENLPPGHYLIVVIVEGGPDETHEVIVL